jgi:hypothetical protein
MPRDLRFIQSAQIDNHQCAGNRPRCQILVEHGAGRDRGYLVQFKSSAVCICDQHTIQLEDLDPPRFSIFGSNARVIARRDDRLSGNQRQPCRHIDLFGDYLDFSSHFSQLSESVRDAFLILTDMKSRVLSIGREMGLKCKITLSFARAGLLVMCGAEVHHRTL